MMALHRWSLGGLVGAIGVTALLALFLPTGAYFAYAVSSRTGEALAERGSSLAQTVAAQAVKPLLIGDELALNRLLANCVSAEMEASYIYVTDEHGEVLAHTFEEGFPVALIRLWRDAGDTKVRYRTSEGPLMDVVVPVADGQLGRVHVGMSRSRARQAAHSMAWAVSGALFVSLVLVMAGAHFVGVKVSGPLRELEDQLSRLPELATDAEPAPVGGTREVRHLARCFAQMSERMGALERERMATQEQMLHAEHLAALGELAGGLAHEIHNPLDGMQECLRYLEADPEKGSRAAKYFPMLREGLERVAAAMQGLLTFARSGQELRLEPCAVAEVIGAVEMLMQPHLEGRQVRLIWRASRPCRCMCDRQALSQTLLNLVLNAAEAAEKGDSPRVLIEATCNARWVSIVVEDSGPGVPSDIQDRIFEPFFTTKPVGKGTGLGLSVSRQLTRAVGGELLLSAEAARLGGARFVIRLRKLSAEDAIDE